MMQGAIMLTDGLFAGFLFEGAHGTRKAYYGFTFASESVPVAVRECNSGEKTILKRQVYGERCVRSIQATTSEGQECDLFVDKNAESGRGKFHG